MSKMIQWTAYRMWRRPVNVVANTGSTSTWLGEWVPTQHIFRGRNQVEAQKKADKFWRECQFGPGSMMCIPDGQSMES